MTSDPRADEDLVLLPNSHWASNIGNPFFTLAAEHLLESVFPDSRVLQTAQLSSVAWDPSEAQMERSLKYVQYYEPDWLVLCGPMMKIDFVDRYESVLERMPTDEMNIVMLSVGSIEYDQAEIDRCREFLAEYPPSIFFSRDSWTYDQYHDLADRSYDGIDLAFFCTDYYPGFPTPGLEPYISLTFDWVAEPDVKVTDPTEPDGVQVGQVRHGPVRRRIGRRLTRSYPTEIDEYEVVRPTHGVLDRSTRSLYGKPNAFFSQTPYGYLNIYRNTSLTLSDRVHACVPTLAYGGIAQLFTQSPRARLFERVGAGDILDQPVSIDPDYLRTEKEQLTSELSDAIQAVRTDA